MVELKPLSDLRKTVEKAFSDSIATPKLMPTPPRTPKGAPKPLKEATKK